MFQVCYCLLDLISFEHFKTTKFSPIEYNYKSVSYDKFHFFFRVEPDAKKEKGNHNPIEIQNGTIKRQVNIITKERKETEREIKRQKKARKRKTLKQTREKRERERERATRKKRDMYMLTRTDNKS